MYQPLEPSKAEFRVLRLLQISDGEIECELEKISLRDDEAPLWKALSYRWGDDEPSHTIHVDGQPVLIRDNLHGFLKQALKERRHDWFFIDALCINQGNAYEQAHQVTLMRDIYRGAEEVYAWIVPEPVHVARNLFLTDEEEVDLSPPSDPETAVLNNSFWSRTWVIQEVLLAKRLSIRVGDAEVEWLNLLPESVPLFKRRGVPSKNEGLEKMHNGMSPTVHKTLALQTLSWRRYHTRDLRAGHHLPFHKAVDFWAPQSCRRLHDKIYGILGLTNSRIEVDYSSSVMEVFMATLADYFLSLGFATETMDRFGKRKQSYQMAWSMGVQQSMVAPFLALGMDPLEPIVYLVTTEIADFFALSKGQRICEMACLSSWSAKYNAPEAMNKIFGDDPKFEFMYIGSACIRFVKHVSHGTSAYKAELAAIQNKLRDARECDSEMTAPGEDGQTKKYGEWVASARKIAEEMWQRFQDSGEDLEGNMGDEEGWTLVG